MKPNWPLRGRGGAYRASVRGIKMVLRGVLAPCLHFDRFRLAATAPGRTFPELPNHCRVPLAAPSQLRAEADIHAGQVSQADGLTVVQQRIFFGKTHKSCGAVLGCRIGASTFRKSEILNARSAQQPRKAIVSFNAARLVIKPVLLFALLGEL